jgi:hypothetical protein
VATHGAVIVLLDVASKYAVREKLKAHNAAVSHIGACAEQGRVFEGWIGLDWIGLDWIGLAALDRLPLLWCVQSANGWRKYSSFIF